MKMNKLINGRLNCYLIFWDMQKDIIYVVQDRGSINMILTESK